jgi:hypothetical protein
MSMRRQIPVYDIGAGGAAALAEAAPGHLHQLYRNARRLYTPHAVLVGDLLSQRWLERTRNPYLDEIRAVQRMLPGRAAYLMTMSYEWACTTSVAPDPAGTGMRLCRTLDWKLKGLGRTLIMARQHGPAGDYLNATWPGAVGIYTAMAPGRFAVAINQPPLHSHSRLTMPLDWLAARARQYASSDLPPSHLVRRVFETCADYHEALAMLRDTPLCVPVFFSLAGNERGEGCIIERTEHEAIVHEAPAAIANHWIAIRQPGRPRGRDSKARHACMLDAMTTQHVDFAWVQPPIRNKDTRVAAEMNPATGDFALQGWEGHQPVTEILRLREPPRAARRSEKAG